MPVLYTSSDNLFCTSILFCSLHLYAFPRAFDRWDAATKNPTIVRMIKTINIMIILMHVVGKTKIYVAFKIACLVQSGKLSLG